MISKVLGCVAGNMMMMHIFPPWWQTMHDDDEGLYKKGHRDGDAIGKVVG